MKATFPRPVHLTRRALIGLACGWALLPAALAGSAEAQGADREITLSADQRQLVKKVEDHLNGITTMQSTFFQQTSNNEFAEGRIFLSRPGKMRIEYKPPVKVVIVASGDHLSYLDREINQLSHIPIEDTPAAFLLREQITFDPANVAFHEVIRENGNIYITVADRKDSFGARLTLIFREKPLSLRKWSVLDAQGNITDIVLTDPFFGGTIDDKAFHLEEAEQQRSGD
ncbi:MAG: outer membrane lipoprotein carrier protein LolA [Rhodospirillaceae bacterium]